MKIVFATNNPNKIKEIQLVLPDTIEILSLREIGCNEELPENQDTLEGNALEKAKYVKEKYGYDCFAEDTGLEIECINNEPGVYSARYAGPERSDEKNMNLVLSKMKESTNRKARFRTIITLILNGEIKNFEGIANGNILRKKMGMKGFGYDPIFKPEGYEQSFAQLGLSIKKEISHRSKAVEKLLRFLNALQ
tara:strand:- start:147 stop:725 length:579 start_codon:yes stop_codon:yes gene_type:complete